MDKWLTKRTRSRVEMDGEGSSTLNPKPSKQGRMTRKLEESKVSERPSSHIIKTNEKAVRASYRVSLRMAKAGEPPTAPESFFLPLMKEIFKILSPEKLKELDTILLSSDTVAHRIDKMSHWVEDQLIQRVGESKFFSLQLDVSTSIDLCHLLVFVRYIWNNELHEDLLCCEPLLQITSEEIFQTLNTYINKKGLDWIKCVGICTDGARDMCGKNSSVVTRLLEVCPYASWTHCNIHREAFVSKSMSDNLRNVLKTSIEIVNFIKPSYLLQLLLFEKLGKEMDSTHETLLLRTWTYWLSKGKVLTRLVEHREEIATFLDDISDLAKWLRNEEFVLELAYLADIFSKLNELNLYLQGTDGAGIFASHDKIRGFIKKLILWKENIEDRKWDCFETFETLIIRNEGKLTDGIITEITTHLSALKENFDHYFFEEMNNCQQKNWIVNPYQDNMMTGISIKADNELIDLSSDLTVKQKFNRRNLAQFWLSVQQTFPTLSAEALKVLLLFSSSYLCEVGISAMAGIENKCPSNRQLSSYLRLQISTIDVDVDAVINSNWNQVQPSYTSQYE